MPTLRKEHDKSEEGACRAQDCIAHKYGGNIAFHIYSIKPCIRSVSFPTLRIHGFMISTTGAKGRRLMMEEADAGEGHSYAVFIASLDDIVITH